jgi:hypothetical protein
MWVCCTGLPHTKCDQNYNHLFYKLSCVAQHDLFTILSAKSLLKVCGKFSIHLLGLQMYIKYCCA